MLNDWMTKGTVDFMCRHDFCAVSHDGKSGYGIVKAGDLKK